VSGVGGDEEEEFPSDLWDLGWRPLDHEPINEEVEAHIERCFGPVETVLHELLSSHVHLDVNVIPPVGGRDFTLYVTSGMSDLPMKVDEGVEDAESWNRAELLIALPGPPIDRRDHYLVHDLRTMARYPHAQERWLCHGHTVGGEEVIGPDTAMTGYILDWPSISPLVDPTEACELKLRNGELVHFFALVPIYPEELDLKLAKGSQTLLDRLERSGVSELYRPDRGNAAGLAASPRIDLSRFFRRR
jgi:hypothetical protein